MRTALIVDAADAVPELKAHRPTRELLFFQTKALARLFRDEWNGVAWDDRVVLDCLV